MIIRNSKKQFHCRLLVFLVLILSVGILFSQSSTNYKLTKSVVDQAGAPSQSANHKLVDAIGQPSPLGTATSTNYKEASGFFAKGGTPGGVPITPVATSPQSAGAEFWVEVVVGNNTDPVTNLFGVSFDVDFTNTTYIDVVTPHASNVVAGNFLGSDLVFYSNVNETAGKVNVGITRKSGAGGVNGFGTLLRIKFKSDASTPNNTPVQFSISNVSANDPVGGSIPLVPGSVTINITSGIIVWSGDTDNNGIVNQTDILPLGLHWGRTGPARTCHSNEMQWIAHTAIPWTPLNATYADANGDGTVNQNDVLPIGLNWGKTHTGLFAGQMMKYSSTLAVTDTSIITFKCSGNTNPGEHFYIDIVVKKLKDLFGLSFELFYSPTSFLDSLKVEEGTGNILGNDLIFFPVVKVSSDTGKVSLGISRKFGQAGVTADSGIVTRINLKMRETAVIYQSSTLFWFKTIFANDPVGNTIAFKTEKISWKLVTGMKQPVNIKEGIKVELPAEFTLKQNYPNPFNPSTTIEFALPKPAFITLKIYNLSGEEVATLIAEQRSAGIHQLNWDARGLASGVYLYRLEAGEFVQSKKLILMR